MTTYIYTRAFSNGKWNINNPNDVDSDGQAVSLAERIKDALPTKVPICVHLNETEAKVTLETLTSEEKTILDNVVATHENASGQPTPSYSAIWTAPDFSQWGVQIDNNGNFISTKL